MNSSRRILLTILLLSSVAGCGDDGGMDDAGMDDAGSPAVLRVLLTNDDGVGAEGIDALVEAFDGDPLVEVIVCAPESNRSGSGDKTIATDPTVCAPMGTAGEITSATTLSGFPSTAINGCPADAVEYALANLYSPGEPPHLVVSGLNEGQNVSIEISDVSGTVGAARVAARNGVPGLATSQGHTATPPDPSYPDYPAGVTAVVDWIAHNRDGLLDGTVGLTEITSLNIPSCATGTVRGTEVVPLTSYMAPVAYPGIEVIAGSQDCSSTLLDPSSDLEAFFHGFVSSAQVPTS